ncbi:S41 family peptidase [Variovorax paradoxus]|uniref:S41 family peptidase n=1 Tax=Variovorax paradoxus TaxID=34073 RepID=UPI001D17D03D|nr:S41 family peptidase [Variovorax paradoxus]
MQMRRGARELWPPSPVRWRLRSLACWLGAAEEAGVAVAAVGSRSASRRRPPRGGGDSDAIVASSTVAGQCAAPRPGINPETGRAYPDVVGTVDNEKSWVRGWIDETYLWYNEVPTTLKASDYATPQTWFDVLKTPATTPSGRAKDRFHFTNNTEAFRLQSEGGVSAGYGMEMATVRSSVPRNIRIAFVEPGSPAAAAGLARGAKLVVVDGIDVVSAPDSDRDFIFRTLSPRALGEKHTFTFEVDGTRGSPVELTAQRITSTPVQFTRTIGLAGNRVGYLLFNDHITTAEAQLVEAVNTLKQDGGIQDLVIDMRYNGGGQLRIASRLAYMVAGPGPTNGRTFELLTFNDKNPYRTTLADNLTPFFTTTRTGQPLPTLNLSRVTLLTSGGTCSASESVINSLRGVGVTVNLVGTTTCGKPYGFVPQDNCGTTYFAVNFKGVNQAGFGDYGDGFAPHAGCVVSDDFSHPLGDPAERRLAAALRLRDTGSCAAPTASAKAADTPGLEKGDTPLDDEPALLPRSPLRENRLIDRVPAPV